MAPPKQSQKTTSDPQTASRRTTNKRSARPSANHASSRSSSSSSSPSSSSSWRNVLRLVSAAVSVACLAYLVHQQQLLSQVASPTSGNDGLVARLLGLLPSSSPAQADPAPPPPPPQSPNQDASSSSSSSSSRPSKSRAPKPFHVRPSLPFPIPSSRALAMLDANTLTSSDEKTTWTRAVRIGAGNVESERRERVRRTFVASWRAYVRDAWGYDEYHPLSRSGTNLAGGAGGDARIRAGDDDDDDDDEDGAATGATPTEGKGGRGRRGRKRKSVKGGMGYMIVDSIDTMLLMGLGEEYLEARDWVRDELDFDVEGRFNVFETTIRTLGGLLSAHALCTSPHSPSRHLCAPLDADLFLSKARDLARRLAPAFETPTGVPLREVDLRSGRAFADEDNMGAASLAEATTVQLEFKYLAHLLDDARLWRLAERPMATVREATRLGASDGLLPIFLSPESGRFYLSEVRLGSRGDSYYEYLAKQWVQTNRTEPVYRDMYDRAVAGIKKHLVKRSLRSKPPLLYTAEMKPVPMGPGQPPRFELVPKQDHLVCFLGGTFMYSAVFAGQGPIVNSTLSIDAPANDDDGDDEHDRDKVPGSRRGEAGALYPPLNSHDLGARSRAALEDWCVGHELIRTCVATYKGTASGLAPEIVHFRLERPPEAVSRPSPDEPEDDDGGDFYIKKLKRRPHLPPPPPLIDARNILRPETVESLWTAYHVSGDPIYRDWAWEIFEAFVRVAKVPPFVDEQGVKWEHGGYANVRDVQAHPLEGDLELEDRMETFWLAETLKYLYLIFSDQSLLRLDRWVMNTEAHPLPIFNPQFPTSVE